VKRVPGLFQG